MVRAPPRSTLFPTRRSSDLAPPGKAPAARSLPVGGRARPRHDHHPRPARGAGACAAPPPPPRRRPAGRSRSEEHTSELQSRFDLVCRLLLEKKKQNNKNASL